MTELESRKDKVDYVRECKTLERVNESLQTMLRRETRVIDVLLAVGLVSREKVEKAREIVDGLE